MELVNPGMCYFSKRYPVVKLTLLTHKLCSGAGKVTAVTKTEIGRSIDFIKVFLRNPATVGAIAPSSKCLAAAMTHGLNLGVNDSVIELGPGTGSLTNQIRNVIARPEAYLGVELQEKFVTLLRNRFPGLQFVRGSAALTHQYCSDYHIAPVRAIISGIPFTTLPLRVQREIIHCLDKVMQPGCVFRTFQYVHAYPLPLAQKFRNEMQRTFGRHHRSKIVFKNLPPAYVLTWTR